MAFAVPAPMNNNNNSSRDSSQHHQNWLDSSFSNHTAAADEATVDAYAMKVLEDASPPDVAVDAEYLGSYITGVLRAEEVMESQLEELPDYDSVLELLQEHCSMTRQDAKITLQKIAHAVVTGIVPRYPSATDLGVGSPALGPFGSPPNSSVKSRGLSALQLLESVNVEEAVEESHNSAEFTSSLQGQVATTGTTGNNNTNATESAAATGASLISPVRPDNLIPFDLLGAIEDDEDATNNQTQTLLQATNFSAAVSSSSLEDEFPSLAVAAASKISKKASRSSRSRQGSIDESSLMSDHSSKKVSPSLQPAQPGPQQQQPAPYYYTLDGSSSHHHHHQQEQDPATLLQMACDMLQQINPDMGQDAIFHAATMAQSNVGIAQYLMDCAMTAPPICRHLLHAGCYRSDCQFSHDLEGHTCVFWVRGRCTKGTTCPFLHGYNEKWLVQLEEQQQQAAEMEQQAYQQQDYPYYQDGSSWEQQGQPQASDNVTSSFANIASQGYNDQTCFQQARTSSGSLLGEDNSYFEETKLSVGAVPTMRIPQDVWNPHERRDATAFHIADPMERYLEVTRLHQESGGRVGRTDVIDLHFQSTKTYAAVLEHVLPEKLASETQGVWIVTGTGHHVSSKTHQKGGGILESAVMVWLAEHSYDFFLGRDRNGHGGALYVKNTLAGSILQ